jgi:hypothetical protein
MLQYQRDPENTLKIVKLLLENGPHPNSRFRRYRSYGGNVSDAARNGHLEIV